MRRLLFLLRALVLVCCALDLALVTGFLPDPNHVLMIGVNAALLLLLIRFGRDLRKDTRR